MRRDPLSCPDPIADRRLAYGRAAAREGDWGAASDLFEQTIERAPDWALAHFSLGEAREKLGDRPGAAAAFRAALETDPSDAQGARARLTLIEGGSLGALPAAYVARLFDDYAPRFEAHLTGKLNYRGPEFILAALDEVAPGRRFARALDLGCGTGLMGEAIRSHAQTLAGVDLSPAMVAKARERGVYDSLVVDDALLFLERAAPRSLDLVVAADTLCYFGDLGPILVASARALAPGGVMVFSVETFDEEGFRLQATMRFAHGPAYVEARVQAAGLRTVLIRPAAVRRELGADVPGMVIVCVTEG